MIPLPVELFIVNTLLVVKKLLLLVLCFYAYVSSAQEIKPINAKNIALNYYKHFNKSETKLDLKLIYTCGSNQ